MPQMPDAEGEFETVRAGAAFADGLDAGVIDENVERLAFGQQTGGEIAHGLLTGKIKRQEAHLRICAQGANFFQGLGSALFVAVGQ